VCSSCQREIPAASKSSAKRTRERVDVRRVHGPATVALAASVG